MVKSVVLDSQSSNQFSEITQQSAKVNQEEQQAKKAELKAIELDFAKMKDAEAVEKRKLEAEAKKSEENSEQGLDVAYKEISEFMNLYNRNVNFSTDEKSDKTIIKVFDSDSKELIKQFPSDDLIELAHKIKELRQDVDLKSGIFLDEKV
jgi:flagellar protein FlaG